MRAKDTNPRDLYVAEVVSGKTLVDVGGLWGWVDEKVTLAATADAASTAMLDIRPPDFPLWHAFRERCAGSGVSGCQANSAGIDEPGLESKIDQSDVVHCSGLPYHRPSPIHTLGQLARISREYLILTTAVVPSKVGNGRGTISIPSVGALFVPYLPPRQVAILKWLWEASEVSGATGITARRSVWRRAPLLPRLAKPLGGSQVQDRTECSRKFSV